MLNDCPSLTQLKLVFRYKLHLLASDGKWEDYTTVTVNVVNKNDEAPVFTVNEYYGSVTEELDGSPVFVLQVRPKLTQSDEECVFLLFFVVLFLVTVLFLYLYMTTKRRNKLYST